MIRLNSSLAERKMLSGGGLAKQNSFPGDQCRPILS